MRRWGFGWALVLAASVAAAQGSPPKPAAAQAVMKAAHAKAKEGKKPILVLFGATW